MDGSELNSFRDRRVLSPDTPASRARGWAVSCAPAEKQPGMLSIAENGKEGGIR